MALLRDMQISKSEKNNSWPPPLPNPGTPLGIDSKILLWITNFLNNRKQRVVVDGSFSNYADVESGIPQGTVLGPLLFLLHINDLLSCVNSKVRLFADDCLLYREIKNNQDQIDMKRDLDALMDWGSTGDRNSTQKSLAYR